MIAALFATVIRIVFVEWPFTQHSLAWFWAARGSVAVLMGCAPSTPGPATLELGRETLRGGGVFFRGL
jgi:hypothetical protein